MQATAHAAYTRQFIAGAWRAGRSATVIEDLDPYRGERLTALPGASVEDIDDAFAAAAAAQPAWAGKTPFERAGLLLKAAALFEKRREEIMRWLCREAGATRVWADMISRHAVLCCSEAAAYAQQASGRILPSLIPGQDSQVHRKPVGVVAIVTPWNSPINLTLRAVAPALGLGNAVVLKPASETPITGGLIHAEVFAEAGLPSGLLNVTVGASEEIADHFTTHPLADAVSFTGSTPVGRHVMERNARALRMKRLGLELGGNAPLVVLDDADLDQAAAAIVYGRFLHQGQICMSANRILVDDAVHDALVARLKPRVEALVHGDPADPATVVGPLIHARARDAVPARIARAKEDGATMLVGGDPMGLVVPPHLFVDVRPEHALWHEEVFGPVLPVTRFQGDAEGLRLANDTEYGLASAVFTADQARGARFAHGIRAGMTSINDHTAERSC